MTISILSEKQKSELIDKGVWMPGCPVSIDRLRVVTISYIDFNGEVHDDGEITVFDSIAPAVEQTFADIKEAKFPIAKIQSLTNYDGEDGLSMQNNNSSCFNHRIIPKSEFLSLHSYGMAIDINPLQNPFLEIDEETGQVTVSPTDGWKFLNRGNHKPGMVEELVPIFDEQGFLIWGGQWTTPIDYHHFQLPRGLGEVLSVVSYEDGVKIFSDVYKHKNLMLKLVSGKLLKPMLDEYEADKLAFVENFFEISKKYLD